MATAKYVWMNGKLVEYQNATVHFVSAGLQYGLSVFEGIRCYATEEGPAVFRLQEHVDRLFDSAHILGMNELPYTPEQVSDAIQQTISANGHGDCYIRPAFYLGQGGMNMITDAAEPELAIATWEWGVFFSQEAKEQGIRANIASFTRLHPNIMMTKAKIAGNYVSSALAKTESKRNGFDEAIMLGPDGFISECTGENLFIVRDKKIFTPPKAAILEGITRASIFVLAEDLGYTVEEQQISRDQLYVADEIFVCGTAAEVVAIREVDYRRIGAGKMGPVTRAIQQAFEAATRAKHRLSREWLTYVAHTDKTVQAHSR
jgi:branched-chain amino acid aminotransferase